ncbi:hypothetical protein NQ317_005578 [Molorchus minor]|uniref:Uncharacterized protein n=1 Tax=Molorchus minor TaxID=1323400 RepID=A0ABQ9K8Z8_9CUCU|nr:hypothetical protein NQ317_005578 [Molorchus minor]
MHYYPSTGFPSGGYTHCRSGSDSGLHRRVPQGGGCLRQRRFHPVRFGRENQSQHRQVNCKAIAMTTKTYLCNFCTLELDI